MEFLQVWDQHKGSFSRISPVRWSFSYAPANRSWSGPLQNSGFGAPLSTICRTFSQIASPRPFVWTRVINLSQQSNRFLYLEIIHVSDHLRSDLIIHYHHHLSSSFIIYHLIIYHLIIYHPSSITCHLSSIIYHLSPIIYHLSSIIYHLSSIIYHPSSIIYHPSSIIYHLWSIIYHTSSIVYHLSSIISNRSSII